MANKQAPPAPILVPVDFSTHALPTLTFAVDIAAGLGAAITVLHVVHDPADMPGLYKRKGSKKLLRRMEDVAAEMMEEFLAAAREAIPALDHEVKVESMLVPGLPVTRILEVAEALSPRMVVLGSQGRTGLEHLFLGSKAEQVVHLCPFPVTIVKQPGRG